MFTRSDCGVASWSKTSRPPSSWTIQPPRNQSAGPSAAARGAARDGADRPTSRRRRASRGCSPRARSIPVGARRPGPEPALGTAAIRGSPSAATASIPSPSPSSTTIASQSASRLRDEARERAPQQLAGRFQVGTITEASTARSIPSLNPATVSIDGAPGRTRSKRAARHPPACARAGAARERGRRRARLRRPPQRRARPARAPRRGRPPRARLRAAQRPPGPRRRPPGEGLRRRAGAGGRSSSRAATARSWSACSRRRSLRRRARGHARRRRRRASAPQLAARRACVPGDDVPAALRGRLLRACAGSATRPPSSRRRRRRHARRRRPVRCGRSTVAGPVDLRLDRGMWRGLAAAALPGCELAAVECSGQGCLDEHASCTVNCASARERGHRMNDPTELWEELAHAAAAPRGARASRPRTGTATAATSARSSRAIGPPARHAGHPRHAGALPARALRLDGRLRRRPEAADGVPDGGDRRAGSVARARSSRGRSPSTASASTTRCRSSATRTSATSRASGSSGSRS